MAPSPSCLNTRFCISQTITLEDDLRSEMWLEFVGFDGQLYRVSGFHPLQVAQVFDSLHGTNSCGKQNEKMNVFA